MLKRERYLSKIRPFYEVDLIKVLLGVRRSGKSEILKQVRQELIDQGIKVENILYLNFEDLTNSHLLESKLLNDFVLSYIDTSTKSYLFFDEIQVVHDFERVLASLKASQNVSIFVTGSNSNLLSGELATLLAGRYVSFKIYPFMYQEACEYMSQLNKPINHDQFFIDYLQWGGFPQRFDLGDQDQVRTYLIDLFESIVSKDVLQKTKDVDHSVISRILKYLFDNNAKLFSIRKVYTDLYTIDKSIQPRYIYSGITRILNAQIVNECKRYDIKGREILTQLEKYYVVDMGLKSILNTKPEKDIGFSIETVLYNELTSRGYQCHVGKTYKGEVDFVVIKNNKKCFIQACYYLASEDIVEREFGAFSPIRDESPKYVISLDKVDFTQNGINHLNLIEFLLGIKDISLS